MDALARTLDGPEIEVMAKATRRTERIRLLTDLILICKVVAATLDRLPPI